jgi:capsular polysaccharide biosynthesis protein
MPSIKFSNKSKRDDSQVSSASARWRSGNRSKNACEEFVKRLAQLFARYIFCHGHAHPPTRLNSRQACAISRINPDEGMKPIIGYIVALLIGTLIVAAVPWISIGFL